MKSRFSQVFLAAVLAITFALATNAPAQEKILHTFTSGKDGSGPDHLVADAAGNLYGTAVYGGNVSSNCYISCGVVFKLTPTASGPWKETMLYHFKGGRDGYWPRSLVLDTAGNIYGITSYGGQPTRGTNDCMSYGCGTVFRLSPNSQGGWTYNLLHAFTGVNDGEHPIGISIDGAGNVFVTTFQDGYLAGNAGTVFELIGGVKGKTVYAFPRSGSAGYPDGPVLIDAAGNLYGNAESGAVYKLTPSSGGTWTESVIYTFTGGNDGNFPYGALGMDVSGNLYGAAADGGANGFGTVFELTSGSSGQWTETTLYAFTGGTDGQYLVGGVVLDTAGNIFTVTQNGGDAKCDCGTLVKLTQSSGVWSETTLHVFTGKADGGGEWPILMDGAGNLFGETGGGGRVSSLCPGGCGVVYEFPGVGAAVK